MPTKLRPMLFALFAAMLAAALLHTQQSAPITTTTPINP